VTVRRVRLCNGLEITLQVPQLARTSTPQMPQNHLWLEAWNKPSESEPTPHWDSLWSPFGCQRLTGIRKRILLRWRALQ